MSGNARVVEGRRNARVVIACDKFKGTLTSIEVAYAIGAGIVRAAPGATIDHVPVADGGDGSVAVALAAGAREEYVDAADAEGRMRRVRIAVGGEPNGPAPDTEQHGGPIATIEAASICGLGANRPGPDHALRASSAGVGQAIGAALDLGARQIVLAVGGTAMSDGGAGMLAALGASLTRLDGRRIGPGALGLSDLARVEFDGLDPRLEETLIVVATDVDNPLLGHQGTAAVFAPQKGADRDAVQVIESGLARWAALASAVPGGAVPGDAVPAGAVPGVRRPSPREPSAGSPGAGAGGGLGYAAMLLGGVAQSGAAYFLEMVGLEHRCEGADLVITGEGRLDSQTLRGKAPALVARIARNARVPCRAVVGSRDLPEESAKSAGFEDVDAIADLDPACVADAELSRELLNAVGARIGAGFA